MSTITENIERILGAKKSIKQSIINKGVNVPDNARIDEYNAYIDTIEQGGGGGESVDNPITLAFEVEYQSNSGDGEVTYNGEYRDYNDQLQTIDSQYTYIGNNNIQYFDNQNFYIYDFTLPVKKICFNFRPYTNAYAARISTFNFNYQSYNDLDHYDIYFGPLYKTDTSYGNFPQANFEFGRTDNFTVYVSTPEDEDPDLWNWFRQNNIEAVYTDFSFREGITIEWGGESSGSTSTPMVQINGFAEQVNGSKFYSDKEITRVKLPQETLKLNWLNGTLTNMSEMCYECHNLESVNLPHLDTSLCTAFDSMFFNCWYLTEVNIPFDFASVGGMGAWGMFYGCSDRLSAIDLTKWKNTDKIKSYHGTFQNCRNLQQLDFTNFNFGTQINNVMYMFKSCGVKQLPGISGLLRHVEQNYAPESLMGMFYDASAITSLDLSGWNVTKVTSINQMFYGNYNLVELDLRGWILSSLTSWDNNLFRYSNKLTKLWIDASFFSSPKFNNYAYYLSELSNWTDAETLEYFTSQLENNPPTGKCNKIGLSATTRSTLTSAQKTRISNGGWQIT